MRISEAREGGSTVRHPSVCSVHAPRSDAARSTSPVRRAKSGPSAAAPAPLDILLDRREPSYMTSAVSCSNPHGMLVA